MNGGLQLKPNETAKIKAPTGWSGRFWARTQCNFDKSGKGTCATGDCGGVLKCNGAGGTPPASLVEITLDSSLDFYDVNFVDGFNIPISVYPSGGHENCSHVKCSADINLKCPKELQVKSSDGKVIACKNACLAFNKPEYCCTEEFNNPSKCKPTKYSQYFKKACPNAYSYVYDDATGAFTYPLSTVSLGGVVDDLSFNFCFPNGSIIYCFLRCDMLCGVCDYICYASDRFKDLEICSLAVRCTELGLTVDSLLCARGGSFEHEATRRMRNEFMAAWDVLRSTYTYEMLYARQAKGLLSIDRWQLSALFRVKKRYIYEKPDVPKASREIAAEVHSELADLQNDEDCDAAVQLLVKAGYPGAQSLSENDWYRLHRRLDIVKGESVFLVIYCCAFRENFYWFYQSSLWL
ncbi:Thaumatin-like protein 1 [Capsicum chinense]|nr:Thaumatin-like protein 1 [Capsicum chinense]